MGRVLEWALRAWGVWLACCAVVWVVLSGGGWAAIPGVDRLSGPTVDSGPLTGALTGPIFGAMFTGEGVPGDLMRLSERLTDTDSQNRAVTAGRASAVGDVNLGWSVQVTNPPLPAALLWGAVHVIPLIVMAWICWRLADVVGQSMSRSPFTQTNARRLSRVGLVLLVGAPLVSVLTWVVYRMSLASTQLADRMEVPDFSLAALPWSTMAAGAGLMILGSVWARGARMQYDVEGLV